MKRGVLLFFFILLLAAFSHGHSFILYDVDVSYDPPLEAGITKAAQDFLDLYETPKSFDYSNELLIVTFDRQLELSVAVHPLDYSIVGFRDDSLVKRGKKAVKTESEMKEIAESFLKTLPADYHSELRYGGVTKLYQGTYQFTWFRHIGELAFIQERFEIEIDPVAGDVVYWMAHNFFYPVEAITLNPAFSASVAQEVANLYMKAETTEVKPVLTVLKNKPVWLVKIKKIYPIYVGLDATNGKIIFTGGLKGELPPNYSYDSAEVIETSFIMDVYGGAY
ncbi:MAG: hypothetical protein O2779_03900 [Nanoarchaeota archaeon]|nr:hypothetical protein [Nanoarchaeota archaeon]